jgi:hypothetical protein
MTETTFEQYCIVELFGHNKIAGRVTDQTIAGHGFIRVDVPATKRQTEFTKFYNPTAVYGMTPVSAELAQAAAEAIWIEPVTVYIAPSHQIESSNPEEEDDIDL